jgi:hypothetical protein
LLKGRVRRTPLSWRPSVGLRRVGALGVIIISIHGVGGFSGRLVIVFIIPTGLGGRNLAVILEVGGVLFRAIRGIHASFLAVFHEVGLNKVLRRRYKQSEQSEEKAIERACNRKKK